MAKDTDVDIEGSDLDADEKLDPPKKSTSPVPPDEDWKARFDGTNRLNGKLERRNTQLEKQYDQMATDLEDAKRQLRSKTSTVETATQELNVKLQAAEAERNALKRDLEKHTVRAQEAKLVGDKFSTLADLHLTGDLRSLSEFSGETALADYEAYLGRMAAKVGTPTTPPPPPPQIPDPDEILRSFAGRSPLSPPQQTPANNKARDALIVSAEMDALDPRDPKDQAKYAELLKELNVSLG